MKRLNLIFTSFVAVLLFFVTWNAFNLDYSIRQSIFNSQKLIDGEKKQINTIVSTHILDLDLDEIKSELVSFYVRHDYDGYIAHVSIGEDLRKSSMIYAYFDYTDDLFEFYTNPHDSYIEFKSPNETQYITNDLSLNSEVVVDYLDTSYYLYRDDYERSFMRIHPLHRFLESDNSKIQDAQLFINIYVPPEQVDEAIHAFSSEILVPFGILANEQSDTTGFIIDSTDNTKGIIENTSLTGLQWQDSILEMPKPLLLIAAVSLLFTNVYLIFSKSKEIYVRRMQGNADSVIFRKIALGTFVQTVGTFILTFFSLWLLYIHSFRPLAMLYTKQLLVIISIYIGLMLVVGVVLFGYLRLKNSILFLKKRFDLSFIFVFATIFKIFAITLVVIPLVVNFKAWHQFEAGITAIEEDPVYLKSIGLQGISQPFYPPLLSFEIHDRTTEWYEVTHESIISLIETQELSFIDMDYYDVNTSFGSEYIVAPFAVTNLNHILFYPITIGGDIYDFSNSEENFIMVPTDKISDFENEGVQIDGFENASIHYVDKTFTQFSNYVGHQNHYEDPILYVIVDDYSMVGEFYNSLRKVIKNETDLDSFNKAVNEFNENVAQFPRLNSQDVYNQIIARAEKEKVAFYILLVITIFIMALFTYLMTYSYIESTKNKLAIKYINGHSSMKRYDILFVAYILSILAIMRLILVYNASVDPWNVDYLSVKPLYLTIILVITVGIDVLVSTLVINRFQRKNVATILKGEGE